MKAKIELVTLTDVKEFCKIMNGLPYEVHLLDKQHDFKVNAKSIIGCLLSQAEWSETWIESEGDCYELIKKWVI